MRRLPPRSSRETFFIQNAPPDIIEKERAKEKGYVEKYRIIESQLKALTAK